MNDNDIMLEAFRKAYHERDHYPDTEEADDWYCEKLGTWKRAWDAATATTIEVCAVVAEKWVGFYPTSTFPADGTSVDDISARAMRNVAQRIAAAIRARGVEVDSCSMARVGE